MWVTIDIMHTIARLCVLTIIILNFNSGLKWVSNLDSVQTISLKIADEWLPWFSNVIVSDLYHQFVIWETTISSNVWEVKLGSTCETEVFSRNGCKQVSQDEAI